jgi:hypothetical protein
VATSDEHLIDVAPPPVLIRLSALDEGVVRGMEVFGGVLVLRGIAASDMAAGKAHPKMEPGVAQGKTLLASARAGSNVVDLI